MTAMVPARVTVAPRSGDGYGCVPDAWRHVGHADRGRLESDRLDRGDAAGRIPADERRLERPAIVCPDVQVVAAADRAHHRQHQVLGKDDAADGAPASLDLHDRGRRRLDDRGQLSGYSRKSGIRHEWILAATSVATHHPDGQAEQNDQRANVALRCRDEPRGLRRTVLLVS